MKKRVVYTALFGGYDILRDPDEISLGIDYICFTDDASLKSKVWRIVHVDSFLPPNIMNRIYKINPHKYLEEYEESLYIDSNIRVLSKLDIIFSKYSECCQIAAPLHNIRCCIYSEAKEVVKKGKASESDVYAQLEKYRNDGYPTNNGLAEMNIIFRKHMNTEVIQLMQFWWEQISKYSKRDQLSFKYSLWRKSDAKFVYMFESSRNLNEFFMLEEHQSRLLTFKSKLKRHLRSILFAKVGKGLLKWLY